MALRAERDRIRFALVPSLPIYDQAPAASTFQIQYRAPSGALDPTEGLVSEGKGQALLWAGWFFELVLVQVTVWPVAVLKLKPTERAFDSKVVLWRNRIP